MNLEVVIILKEHFRSNFIYHFLVWFVLYFKEFQGLSRVALVAFAGSILAFVICYSLFGKIEGANKIDLVAT